MNNRVKTKVMFIVNQFEAGGSERVVLEISKGLDKDLFDIFVASFNNGVLVDSFKEICNDIYIIKKKSGFDFSAMIKLAKIVRDQSIDIVNAHHYMPCFYSFLGTKILNRKKLIYTEHSLPEVEGIARESIERFLI
jgi:L-malate glycosyltransferase